MFCKILKLYFGVCLFEDKSITKATGICNHSPYGGTDFAQCRALTVCSKYARRNLQPGQANPGHLGFAEIGILLQIKHK